MRRLLLVLIATAPLAGCQYLSAGEDIEIIDPIATTIEAQERAAELGENIADAVDGEPDEAAFEEPTVAAPLVVTADLIQSTDPTARAQAVARSRNDPFASLPIPLAPKPVDLPAGAGNNGNNNSNNNGGTSGSTATRPSGPTPPAVRVREEPLIEPSPIAELPPIPQPVIAPGIAVSGIIQLGGTPYAIVRSSNEPERYVKVGDRIGNGSVRVKRIETLAYEPRVIFEENGIEVAKPVGNAAADDPAAAPEETAEIEEILETDRSTEPLAALPAIGQPASLSTPLPIPSASMPALASLPANVTGQAASFLSRPSLPPAPRTMRTNPRTNLLQPARGYVPNSLILLPPKL